MVHAPPLALTLPDVHGPCALGLVSALALTLTLSPRPHHHEDSVPQPPCALVEREHMVVIVCCHPTPSPTCLPSFTLVLQTHTCCRCRPRCHAPTRMAHAPSFTLTSPDMHMCPESCMSSPHSHTCTLALPGALGRPRTPLFSPAPLDVHARSRLRVVLRNTVPPVRCDFDLSKHPFLYNFCLCSISCVVGT